jgi:hypothetical protein
MTVENLSVSRQNSANKWLISLAILFNSLDALFTFFAIKFGAIENNPLMRVILEMDVTYFLYVKLIAVNLLILGVGFFYHRHGVSRIGLTIVACSYAILNIYHMVNLN